MTKKGPKSKSDGKHLGMGNKFEKTAALYVRWSKTERTDYWHINVRFAYN
jgi:hypothetical protein